MGKCFAYYMSDYIYDADDGYMEFCIRDHSDDTPIQFVNVLKKMVCMVGMKPLSVNSCNLYTSRSTYILSLVEL